MLKLDKLVFLTLFIYFESRIVHFFLNYDFRQITSSRRSVFQFTEPLSSIINTFINILLKLQKDLFEITLIHPALEQFLYKIRYQMKEETHLEFLLLFRNVPCVWRDHPVQPYHQAWGDQPWHQDRLVHLLQNTLLLVPH